MKLMLTAAGAALFVLAASVGTATPSQAGATSHSHTIVPGTAAYQAHNCRCRKRHHRRHRAKRKHAHHRRHAHVRHRYSRRAHGPRYRSRRSGYTYHHAGYWYSAMWWVPVRIDNAFSRTLSHAKWCRQQYGIYYDRRSDTYQASDGRTYRCIRPRW